MTLRCWFCVYLRAATTLVNGKPACRTCTRELVAKPRDLSIAPAPKRLALGVSLAVLLMLSAFSYAAETPNAERRCDEATDGARPGEDLTARIARLETQLRLSRAELAVNRGRR